MNGYERIRRDYQEDQETVSRILDAQGRTIPNWRNKTMYQSTGACYSPEERAAHTIAEGMRDLSRTLRGMTQTTAEPGMTVGPITVTPPARVEKHECTRFGWFLMGLASGTIIVTIITRGWF